MDTEAQLLEVIRDLLGSSPERRVAIKDIASLFANRHQDDYRVPISPKWTGGLIRRRLQLKTQKSDGVYVIPAAELPKLDRLYNKYGITTDGPVGETQEMPQDPFSGT